MDDLRDAVLESRLAGTAHDDQVAGGRREIDGSAALA